jgi:porphobilinogen synthase
MNSILRESLSEHKVERRHLILPLFIHEQQGNAEIPSMPGHCRMDFESLLKDVEFHLANGINKFMLFGIPDKKDEHGTEAWREDGVIQKATRLLKKTFGESVYLIGDLCLCEYTSHGHCGLLDCNGNVKNDETLQLLLKTALSYAHSEMDCIAPSGMMDGIVGSLRPFLDEAGFSHLPVMGYSVKFKSAFYGPFRDACDSAPSSGDRAGYQMQTANAREAMQEAKTDWEEGADILMVKPALPYLDIVKSVRESFSNPLAVYNVSGEYSMVKAAGANGWLDEKATALESLLCMKRAGADLIITYWARDLLQWD